MRDAKDDYFETVTLTAPYACATGLSMNLLLIVTATVVRATLAQRTLRDHI